MSDLKPRKLLVLGAATSPHVLARAQVFSKLGWDVTMLSPVAPPYASEDITIISTQRGDGLFGKVRSLITCARLLLILPADVVHAHYAAEYGTWLAALLNRRPLVITVMGGDILFEEQGTLGKMGRFLTRFSLRRADYITAKSKRLAETLGTFGVRSERMDVVYWGVEPELFRPSPNEGKRYRDNLAIPDKRRVIYCPRMLSPLYNQHLLIDALPAILTRCPDTHLVLSGFGRDDTYAEQIENKIEALGLENHVTITGSVIRSEMSHAYNAADVVVSIPSSDGMPQSVLEAMACEKPVLVSNLDHYRELFQEGETACFVAFDPTKIAQQVIDLLENPDQTSKMAKAGAELVRRTADFPSQARHVADSFEQLIAGRTT